MTPEQLLGDYFISDLSTAQTVPAASIPDKTQAVDVQAISQNVRVRVSATPTSTNGGIIYAGSVRRFPYSKPDIAKLYFVQEASGAAAHLMFVS